MFQDEVKIYVEAGKGGDGCTSFRREKFVSMGGPNGGNGGKGSNIVFMVDAGLKTLIDLKMMKNIKGEKGSNGKGSNQNGKDANDIIIKVPEGTTITDLTDNVVLADLVHDKETFVVAHGGRGGRGNKAFANHENPAPKMSELGEPGEKLYIKCELKVLADVGLVGYPSVGKSTILSIISNSNPKIGEYHFTTLSPNLGVVSLKNQQPFVIADLPGLIEGASEGVGLGHQFLRHASRTKIIAHVIDMSGSEGRDPIKDFETIKDELVKYDQKLALKPHIVIANKMDIEGATYHLKRYKNKYPEEQVIPISAKNKENIDELLNILSLKVNSLESIPLYNESELKSHVLYKYKENQPFTIKRENNVWVLSGKEIEKLFYMTRFNEDESVLRFARKLKGMGVDDELSKLGAKRGDEVKILDYIFEFKD